MNFFNFLSKKNKIKNLDFNLVGINISGHFQGEFGTGQALRNYSNAIKQKKIPFVLNNVDDVINHNKTFDKFRKDNPHPVNLIVLNADILENFFKKKGKRYFKNKYNIGIWFWEISEFPKIWFNRFKYLDEIWVASDFILKSLKKQSPIPIIKIKCPVEIDHTKFIPNRNKFKLDFQAFVFLFIFDFNSVFERKNVIGLIDAFNQTFNLDENAMLVIKTMNMDGYTEQKKILVESCQKKNILLIEEHLTQNDIFSLIASIDCYVSLHRSEGYGLTIAEAMSAKKPVIATAYGGNTEFMSSDNSFPVKYDLVEIDKNYGPYEKGNVWANPNLEHASSLMRYVYENPEFAKKIGQKGFETVHNQFCLEKTGNEILDRMKIIYQNQIN